MSFFNLSSFKSKLEGYKRPVTVILEAREIYSGAIALNYDI